MALIPQTPATRLPLGFLPSAIPLVPAAPALGGAATGAVGAVGAAVSAAAGFALGWLAAQLWGWLNSRRPGTPESTDGMVLTWPTGRKVRMDYHFDYQSWTRYNCSTNAPQNIGGGSGTAGFVYGNDVTRLETKGGQIGSLAYTCGGGYTGTVVRPFANNAGGATYQGTIGERDGSAPSTYYGTVPWKLVIDAITVADVAWVPSVIPDPVLPPLPELEPEPAREPMAPPYPWVPAAPPLAPPVPGTPGTDPGNEPGVPPVPAPPATPATPVVPGPGQTPAGTPTGTPLSPWPIGNNGVPLPLPPGPVPQTPIGQEQTPWGPVGGPGQSPRPDLQGIAEEVGRIEQKILRMGSSQAGDLTDLLQLLGSILNWIQSIDGPGEYTLSGPCNYLPDGTPEPPRVAGWGASVGQTEKVIKRLDAIAELLQHHKDLRQPTCKRGPVAGEGVTVQFEEV